MTPRLIIETNDRTKELGDLFGLFFEDLSHAADGGMYGELLQNRSFEFSSLDNREYTPLTAWNKVDQCDLSIGSLNPFHPKNRQYLVMTGNKGDGVENTGYAGGIHLKANEPYRFSCWVWCKSGPLSLDILLLDDEGFCLAENSIRCEGEWKYYEIQLIPSKTSISSRLRICFSGDGSVALDQVSLFPVNTFKGRKNGMRADIAQALCDMKPKFMRFPGGCLTHNGSLLEEDRNSMYRWKNTVGPVESRPTRRCSWGYNQSFGIGFYEYFLFCEDIGAEPVPILPGACNPHHFLFAPMDELQPWIDDALDLIEFANGDIDTKWGAVRAEMGHPEPFDLKYIGIGNEEVHKEFYDRFPYFFRAIREKYPEIKIIGSGGPYPAGGEYDHAWECAKKIGIDIVDEHYYESPTWMIANAKHYHDYSTDEPKVFLGEYASGGNTYWNALCEAVYMVGLQNAPAVAMACYAPMLCHSEYRNWNPNMLWFNNHRILPTASYHVQKLFMAHQGTELLASAAPELDMPETLNETPLNGKLWLEADQSAITLTDIRLEANGIQTNYPDVAISGADQSYITDVGVASYVLTLKAQRTEGERKGFRIGFGRHGEGDYVTWNIGGWENQDTIVAGRHNGYNAPLTQSFFSLVTGRVYDLRLEVSGRKIKTYIDGVLYNDTEDRLPATQPLYHTVSIENETGEIILKAVNIRNSPITIDIELAGLPQSRLSGTKYVLSGHKPEDINSFDEPDLICPKEESFSSDSPAFVYTFPPHSLTVIRVKPEQ